MPDSPYQLTVYHEGEPLISYEAILACLREADWSVMEYDTSTYALITETTWDFSSPKPLIKVERLANLPQVNRVTCTRLAMALHVENGYLLQEVVFIVARHESPNSGTWIIGHTDLVEQARKLYADSLAQG